MVLRLLFFNAYAIAFLMRPEQRLNIFGRCSGRRLLRAECGCYGNEKGNGDMEKARGIRFYLRRENIYTNATMDVSL